MKRAIVIVVPCFNEARRLDREAFLDYARGQHEVGLLFVDDGSSDDTAALLARMAETLPDAIALHRLAHNCGKAEAVRVGMLRALETGAEAVGYWDADLSTGLDEIADFRAILAGNPQILAVLGSRICRLGADIRRRSFRHYAGRIFATLASLVLDLPVYDTQCGAKLFRACDGVRHAFERPFLSRWIFDVEVLARLTRGRRDADRVYEQPLRRWEDVAGSKLRGPHMLAAASDLWRIHRAYPGRRLPERS